MMRVSLHLMFGVGLFILGLLAQSLFSHNDNVNCQLDTILNSAIGVSNQADIDNTTAIAMINRNEQPELIDLAIQTNMQPPLDEMRHILDKQHEFLMLSTSSWFDNAPNTHSYNTYP